MKTRRKNLRRATAVTTLALAATLAVSPEPALAQEHDEPKSAETTPSEPPDNDFIDLIWCWPKLDWFLLCWYG